MAITFLSKYRTSTSVKIRKDVRNWQLSHAPTNQGRLIGIQCCHEISCKSGDTDHVSNLEAGIVCSLIFHVLFFPNVADVVLQKFFQNVIDLFTYIDHKSIKHLNINDRESRSHFTPPVLLTYYVDGTVCLGENTFLFVCAQRGINISPSASIIAWRRSIPLSIPHHCLLRVTVLFYRLIIIVIYTRRLATSPINSSD